MKTTTYKGIMDSAMTATGMVAAGCGIIVELLVSFTLDSVGAIPAATVVTVRTAFTGLLVSGAAFAGLAALRLAVWLRSRPQRTHRPHGERRGVMTPEQICEACRRTRT